MAEIEEFQPTDKSLLRFDGTVLEVFAGSVSGLSYDKDRLTELREFAERVMAVARDQT